METSIIIFYKYTRVDDPTGFVAWVRNECEKIGIFGRILIAHEGINGTVEGTTEQIAAFEAQLHAQDGSAGTFGNFSDVWFKASPGTGTAFKKLKVKARSEIVATGLSAHEDIDPSKVTGTHIEPKELKSWIENGDDFAIVDMRNDYEFAVGHFAGSIDPGMGNFRDLKTVVPKLEHLKGKKVLTVCTYGVRCEKASGYLKQQGFEDVYQLHGGIGTYMKQYPGQDFLGSLYVFDNRMTEQFTDGYQRVGVCVGCGTSSERFGNCAVTDCHKQLIICQQCSTRPIFCNHTCQQTFATEKVPA
jgi:UPF0176 protein